MGKIKSVILIILCAALIVAMPVSAYADFDKNNQSAETYSKGRIVSWPIVVERVDIPLNEALTDATFSISNSRMSKSISTQSTDSTTWLVDGRVQYSGENNWNCQAVGWSGEYAGETLLETYHYTRTYFGSSGEKYGDSGRWWGKGLVFAYGSVIQTGTVTYKIHKVYYGTEV